MGLQIANKIVCKKNLHLAKSSLKMYCYKQRDFKQTKKYTKHQISIIHFKSYLKINHSFCCCYIIDSDKTWVKR